MFYYRYQKDMDATQYVHVHVPSEFLFDGKCYYTHHSDTAAPQYVHADEPSNVLF